VKIFLNVFIGIFLLAGSLFAREPSKEDSLLSNLNLATSQELALTANSDLATFYLLKDSRLSIKYGKQALSKAKTGKEKSKANLLLGKAYRVLDIIDSAKIYTNKVISNKETDKTTLIEAYIELSTILKHSSYFSEALKKLNTADSLNKIVKDDNLEIVILQKTGSMYLDLSDYDNGIRYQFMALELAHKVGNLSEEASIYNNLANVYSEIGELEKALEQLEKAKEIFLELGDFVNYAGVLQNIGINYAYLGELDKSLKLFLQSKDEWEKLDIAGGIADSYSALANLYIMLEDYDKSLEFHEKALPIYKDIKSEYGISNTFFNIGVIYSETKQFKKAIPYFKKSIAKSKDRNSTYLLMRGYEYLAFSYEDSGNPSLALENYKKYVVLKDSIITEEKSKAIAELEEKYKAQQKEIKIAQLETHKAINEASISKRTLQRNTVISLLLAALILIFLMARNYRLKQRSLIEISQKNDDLHKQQVNKLINKQELRVINAMISGQEKERKRIAQDLHDGLGSLLSTINLHFSVVTEGVSKLNQSHKKSLETAQNLMDQAVDEVRRISHNMISGDFMEYGLLATTESLVKTINNTKSISIDLTTIGTPIRFSHNMEIGIYRIIQEILSNALKHAKAKKIKLVIEFRKKEMKVFIEDDGVGFNPKQEAKGLGIKGIENRVSSMKGSVEFDSMAGKGTTINFGIPIT
jgi:two-component system NarL family sensor kinase